MIDELLSAYRLKDEPRAGWALRGVVDPESVADHSWGTALLCLAFAEEAGVNTEHSLRIAIVHDLAEAEVGDIPRRVDEADQPVGRETKAALEEAAIRRLATGPLACAAEPWHEYEATRSPEALFVRDMNLIDMCVQALFYETAGRRDDRRNPEPTGRPGASAFEALDEFFATAEPRIRTDLGRRLFNEIRGRYLELREGM